MALATLPHIGTWNLELSEWRCFCCVKESDYPDFLHGDERENTQHITISYLTDERRKGSSKSAAKNESDERQNNTVKDTILHASSTGQQSTSSKKSERSLLRTFSAAKDESEETQDSTVKDMILHASSTGLQSARSSKSARSLLRTLSAEMMRKGSKSAAKGKMEKIQDNTAKDEILHASSTGQQSAGAKKSARSLLRTVSAQLTSSKREEFNKSASEQRPSVEAAANALSVTARWGLNWRQTLGRRTSTGKHSSTETTTNHVTRSNIDQSRLHKSLDACVLRDALVNFTSVSTIKEFTKFFLHL